MKLLFVLLFSFSTYAIKRAETYDRSVIKLQRSIVVRIGWMTGYYFDRGTGFSIKVGGKYYTLSNSHVCRNYKYMLGYSDFGGKFLLKVLKRTNKPDLCLLQGIRLHKAIPIAKHSPKPNDKIITIGHPKGGKIRIAWGNFIRKEKIRMMALVHEECDYPGPVCIWEFNTYRTNIHIVGGASGSPLMNHKGELVGVIFASENPNWGKEPWEKVKNPHQNGFAIPLKEVNEFLKDIND